MITARTSPRVELERPVARVGFSLPGSKFEARRNKLNSQIVAQQDLNDQTIALRKQGKLSDDDWADFTAWLPAWNSFVSRWGKFQADTSWNWITGPDESSLQDLEKQCYDLRVAYQKIGGVSQSAVAIDTPYKPEPSAFDWGKLVLGVAVVGVAGLGIYYGGKIWLASREQKAATAGRSYGELEPFDDEPAFPEPQPPEGAVRTS